MAFLMLLHEKMRLKRECNKLQLRQLQMSHRKERISKNIKKVQNMYAKKETMIDSQANMLKAQFKNSIYNQAGLGTYNQAFNPYNMSGMGGITSFVMNYMSNMVNSGNVKADYKDGETTQTAMLDSSTYQEIMNAYSQGKLNPVYDTVEEDGKQVQKFLGWGANKDNLFYQADDINCEMGQQINLFKQLLTMAQQQQSVANGYCQQASFNYEQNISIWVDAQKAEIEEQQSAALAPLEMMETEYDLEAELADTELQTKKARLESIEQALKEEIKDGTPKFGLG